MQSPVATARRIYRNPVYDGYFADPFVMPWQGRYIAYGTGAWVDGRVFEVLESPDLASWTRVGGAMEPAAADLGTDYWAPEVVEADGRFWLYYSVGHGDSGHHLRVAVADHPFGPFVDTGVNLTPAEQFAIDPHPFRDADGTWYLFYARDVLDRGPGGHPDRRGHPPVDDGARRRRPHGAGGDGGLAALPGARPMYGSTYDWYTLEGPAVRHHDGTYYCLYSGGSWQTEGYAVAWASAPSPLGPWTEPPAGHGPAAGRGLRTRPRSRTQQHRDHLRRHGCAGLPRLGRGHHQADDVHRPAGVAGRRPAHDRAQLGGPAPARMRGPTAMDELRGLHPRPQLTRPDWTDLSGPWGFAYDDADVGLDERWYEREDVFDRVITVPFPPESSASGIGNRDFHPVVWYRRTFQRRSTARASGCCCISAPSTTGPRSGSTAGWSPSTRAGTPRSPPT